MRPDLIVGCSHPGIEASEAIVAEAAESLHLVAAPDAVIEKVVSALHETYKVERIARRRFSSTMFIRMRLRAGHCCSL